MKLWNWANQLGVDWTALITTGKSELTKFCIHYLNNSFFSPKKKKEKRRKGCPDPKCRGEQFGKHGAVKYLTGMMTRQ